MLDRTANQSGDSSVSDAAHYDHIDVVRIGIAGKHLGGIAHNHVLVLCRNVVTFSHRLESFALGVEQFLGCGGRKDRGRVIEAELGSADR